MTKAQQKRLISFVSQKGGVGKSTLARLLAVGAAHRGHKTLLADFDLEQLTCVEWNATRMRNSVEPEIDARPFKSLKKLYKSDEEIDIVIADTRGLADDMTRELAEDSAVDDGGGWGGVTFAYNGRSREEVDQVLADAASAGAVIGRPAAETFWGGYSGVFIDPDGHPWEVAHNPGWTIASDGSVSLA